MTAMFLICVQATQKHRSHGCSHDPACEESPGATRTFAMLKFWAKKTPVKGEGGLNRSDDYHKRALRTLTHRGVADLSEWL